jgi:hypothetical protein
MNSNSYHLNLFQALLFTKKAMNQQGIDALISYETASFCYEQTFLAKPNFKEGFVMYCAALIHFELAKGWQTMDNQKTNDHLNECYFLCYDIYDQILDENLYEMTVELEDAIGKYFYSMSNEERFK